jgi:uncharacterized protein DUF4241
MTTTWGAVFADGWNGALINPLTRAEAAARDTSGEAYAVVLLADGRVRAEVRVVRDYLAVLCYDGRGRERAMLEFRPDGGDELTLWTERTWDGPESLTDERFARTAARESRTWYRGSGRFVHRVEPQGDLGGSGSTSGVQAAPRFGRPVFGHWSELLERAGLGWVELTDASASASALPTAAALSTDAGDSATALPAAADASAAGLPTARSDGMPWRAPRPLAPGDLAALFASGTERPVAGGTMIARTDVVAAGKLRMPSGRLVAAAPDETGEVAPAPFTVTVEPGVYPLTVSLARIEGDVADIRVAAVRLEVTDRPVVSWELARQPGQDLLELADGHYFGVGVDGGLACFADADLWAPWSDRDGQEEFTLVDDGAMLVYHAGWGDGAYPTWLGRDAAGEVVCFVTDMLL